jgi:hypothetical protein
VLKKDGRSKEICTGSVWKSVRLAACENSTIRRPSNPQCYLKLILGSGRCADGLSGVASRLALSKGRMTCCSVVLRRPRRVAAVSGFRAQRDGRPEAPTAAPRVAGGTTQVLTVLRRDASSITRGKWLWLGCGEGADCGGDRVQEMVGVAGPQLREESSANHAR